MTAPVISSAPPPVIPAKAGIQVPNRAHVRASAQSATQRADYVVQRNSRLVISSGAEKSLGAPRSCCALETRSW